jgi:hypothetical protein
MCVCVCVGDRLRPAVTGEVDRDSNQVDRTDVPSSLPSISQMHFSTAGYTLHRAIGQWTACCSVSILNTQQYIDGEI